MSNTNGIATDEQTTVAVEAPVTKPKTYMYLPLDIQEAQEVNPKLMVIAGKEGIGKTTAFSMLGNKSNNDRSLIVDTESGTRHLKSLHVRILHISNFLNPNETREQKIARIERKEFYLDELIEIIQAANASIYERTNGAKRFVYKYGIIDTLTTIDQWSEIAGTYSYMKKSQGKKFNLKDENNVHGPKYCHTDKEFDTVHSIGEGYGYRYSRAEMVKYCLDLLPTLFEYTILSCHIEVNRSTEKGAQVGSEVKTSQIDLTGALRKIFARRADSVGFLYRDENKLMVNFETNDESASKNRCPHLASKAICLLERNDDGTFIDHWDQIYI